MDSTEMMPAQHSSCAFPQQPALHSASCIVGKDVDTGTTHNSGEGLVMPMHGLMVAESELATMAIPNGMAGRDGMGTRE